jgi:hypothetical protein
MIGTGIVLLFLGTLFFIIKTLREAGVKS